jgi:1-deoxy-D-xylulose-5-phosphate synthase
MLYTGFLHDGPCAVRYPRGTGPGTKIIETMSALPIGRADVLREGQRVALLCFGSTVQPGFEAGEQLNATVVNMRFVKPLDEDCVLQLAETHDLLITVEDNAVEGGAGSGVNECLAKNDHLISIRNLGLPDRFLDHASREELLHEAGLDRDGIIAAVQETLAHPALAKRATLA